MDVSNWLIKSAAAVTAISSIGASGAYVVTSHQNIRDELKGEHSQLVQASDYHQHLSTERGRTISQYVRDIQANGPTRWLCDALVQEISRLCSEDPQHAMCKDRAAILRQTGCRQ